MNACCLNSCIPSKIKFVLSIVYQHWSELKNGMHHYHLPLVYQCKPNNYTGIPTTSNNLQSNKSALLLLIFCIHYIPMHSTQRGPSRPAVSSAVLNERGWNGFIRQHSSRDLAMTGASPPEALQSVEGKHSTGSSSMPLPLNPDPLSLSWSSSKYFKSGPVWIV